LAKAVADLAKAKNVPAVKQALSAMGFAKTSDVPPKHIAHVVGELNKLAAA
jgi:hypothetical protein